MKLATEYIFSTTPSSSPSGGSVFVRGVSEVQDTYIENYDAAPVAKNYGNDGLLQLGEVTSGGHSTAKNLLVGFDVSSIPAGSTITSASIFIKNAGNGTYYNNSYACFPFYWLGASKFGWTETGVDGVTRDGATSFDDDVVIDSGNPITLSLPNAASDISIDVTTQIKDAVDNRAGYFTFFALYGGNQTNTHLLYFYSSEAADPANRPTLTVNWTAPLNAVSRTQSYASGYDSTKVNVGQWITQKGGPNYTDNYAGPIPLARINCNEQLVIGSSVLSALDAGNNIHWVFQFEITAAATHRVTLATYDTMNQVWNYKGYVTITFPPAVNEFSGSMRVAKYVYQTGTASVSGTAVTGTATGWQSAKYAAGARIGFGSIDPNAITDWYYISTITNDTSITLTTTAGTISDGPFVIEELRIYCATYTSGPATNGGLFVAKGVNFDDFTVGGTTIAAATSVDNIKAVYWLADATTNVAVQPSGLALGPQSDASHIVYLIDNFSSGNIRIFKFDVRTSLTVFPGSAGKSTQAFILRTATIPLPNSFMSITTSTPVLATTKHGPGAGVSCLYLPTQNLGRILRIPETSILSYVDNNTGLNAIADYSMENPSGGNISFPLAGNLGGLAYDSTIDRFILNGTLSVSPRQSYVTKYSVSDSYDRTMFAGNNIFHTSNISPSEPPIFSPSGNVPVCFECVNGILYSCRGTGSNTSSQIYAIPLSSDWEFAAGTSNSTQNRLILPSMATPNCSKFYKVSVQSAEFIGSDAIGLQTESYRVYARTNGIVEDSGAWTLLPDNGDLSSFLAAENIQFMFEFKIIGALALPARIYGLTCTYEDHSNSRYFQPSEVFSNAVKKIFAWRISTAFNTSIPALTVKYIDATNGGVVLTDSTSKPTYGKFYKSTDGGSTWFNYNLADRTNENTYIRYTPTIFPDNIKVRAVLNLSKDGLTANFSASPTSGFSVVNVGLVVNFTDLTMGNKPPTGWSWTFGDGGTSTAQNPSYAYFKSGSYSVSLTVTNADSSSTYTRTNYILVDDVLDDAPRFGRHNDPTAATVAHGEGPEWINGGGIYDVNARIPVMTTAPDGSILLFFQGSISSGNDYGTFAIRVKRSTDNGVTWGVATDVFNNPDYQNNSASASFGFAGTWLALGGVVTDNIGMSGNSKSVNLLYTYHDPSMHGKSTYLLDNTVSANVVTLSGGANGWPNSQPVTFTGTNTFLLNNTLSSGSIQLNGGDNGWATGVRIKFSGGGNAFGLNPNIYYYIAKTATDKFKIYTNSFDASQAKNTLTLVAGTGTNNAETGPFGLMPNYVYWLYMATTSTFKVCNNYTDAQTGASPFTLVSAPGGSTCNAVQAADAFKAYNVRSTDNGVTWGTPTEITTNVNNSALTYTFTASTATNLITFSTTPNPPIAHGQEVSFTNSGGALPTPLSLVGPTTANVNYRDDKSCGYYLYMNSATTATIYTTNTDALTNTGSNKITLTSNGSGTNTVNFIYYWMAATSVGIQMSSTSSNPGRLIVPFDHRTGGMVGPSFTHCIKSDDGGVTWSLLGGVLENATNAFTNETAITTTNFKDRLYANCRNVGSSSTRLAAFSNNGGVTWSDCALTPTIATNGGTQVSAMIQVGTSGSMIRFKDIIIVASTNDTSAGSRVKMALWVSSDEGLTWTLKKILHYRHCSYSAMVVLDAERFMIVFEASADNTHSSAQFYGSSTNYLCSAVINKNWLMNGTQYSDYFFNEMRSDQMAAGCKCNPHSAGFIDYGSLNAPAGAISGSSPPVYAGSDGGVILDKDKLDGIVISSPMTYVPNYEFQLNSGESGTFEIEATITDNGIILSNMFNKGIQLESSSGNLKVTLKDGTNTATVTGASTITGAGRQTYALVRDAVAKLLKLYINGALEASIADTTGDIRVISTSTDGYPHNNGMWIGQSPLLQFNNNTTSVDAGNDVITLQATHGWADGQAVMVANDGNQSLPAPLAADTVYYIRGGATGSNDTYKVYLYDTSAHAIAGGGTGLINLTTTGGGSDNVSYMAAVNTASPYSLGATIWSARITRGVVAAENLIQPNRTKTAVRTYRNNFTPALPTYNSSYTPLNISSLHTWLYATAYQGEGMYADMIWSAHGNNPLPWPDGASFKSQRDQSTKGLLFNSSAARHSRYYTSDPNVGPYCKQLYNYPNSASSFMSLSKIHNKNIYDFLIGTGANGNCKFSIAFAIKFNSDANGSNQYVLDNTYDAATSHNGCVIYKDTSGKMNLQLSTASTAFASVNFSVPTFNINTWYFMMFVANGYNALINFYYQTLSGTYVYNTPYNSATNCSTVNSAGNIGTVTPGTVYEYLSIGSRGDLAAPSDISLKNFMIFDNSLTSTDADNLARYCVSA